MRHHTLTRPLTRPTTYRHWAYLVIGGALLVPYAIAALVLSTLIFGQLDLQSAQPTTYLLAAALTLTLTTTSAYLPGLRTAQIHLAHALLQGPLTHLPHPTRTTWRIATWLTLHLITGMAACMATMITLTDAALLALTPLLPRTDPAPGLTLTSLYTGPDPTLTHTLTAPLLGLALVLALLYAIAATGTLLARAAPHFLGPTPTDRLAAAHAHAHTLAERNRLARELHDSLGHALSAITLQAGTAARLLHTDPHFAHTALTHIAHTARTATADLDHALGILRQDTTTSRTPPPDLTDLNHLAQATQHTGTDLTCHIHGRPETVPTLASRESYRIAQEALTNALRHAPDQPLSLTLHIDTNALTLTVTNPLPPHPTHRPDRKARGLRGMRERAHMLGGTLTAASTNTHWTLTLHLTWKAHP